MLKLKAGWNGRILRLTDKSFHIRKNNAEKFPKKPFRLQIDDCKINHLLGQCSYYEFRHAERTIFIALNKVDKNFDIIAKNYVKDWAAFEKLVERLSPWRSLVSTEDVISCNDGMTWCQVKSLSQQRPLRFSVQP